VVRFYSDQLAAHNDFGIDGDSLRWQFERVDGGNGTASRTERLCHFRPDANFNGTARHRVLGSTGGEDWAGVSVEIARSTTRRGCRRRYRHCPAQALMFW
jgi:hypothetical protein